MKRWTQVRWTEAGQVGAILGWPASEHDAELPETVFDRLRAQGRDDHAVMFLSQALPRFEVVSWATRCVREATPASATKADQDALKAVFLWLQDPTDNRRRAAFEAAGQVDDISPQRLCALAAFFSGGSLAPADAAPVPSPKEAAGKFAAGAVLIAAARSGQRQAELQAALRLGDALASGAETARP